jgi:poly-gamma-glutamate capsule biosynthesis protein CapA/YwtB (metallophosphatase superfamily)
MRLLFVGDIMLGRLVNRTLRHVSPFYLWGDMLALFEQADVRIANLECALSDRGEPWSATPKIFHFRLDARNVEVLKAAQMTAVSLANNHVLDFGYEALGDTLDILHATGIFSAGAGRQKSEAMQPALWEMQGIKLGLIAFTDNQPEWEATEQQAGVYYVPVRLQDERAQQLFALVSQTRALVDVLIIAAHWGPNWGFVPPSEHIPFAHALVDHGADVLFGHSGHVVRGIELYRRRPILYCAGDFIDDYAIDPIARNDLSFLFMLEIEGRQMTRLLLYPTIIQDFQARRAQDADRERIVVTMRRLCTALGTATTWNEQEGRLEIALV